MPQSQPRLHRRSWRDRSRRPSPKWYRWLTPPSPTDHPLMEYAPGGLLGARIVGYCLDISVIPPHRSLAPPFERHQHAMGLNSAGQTRERAFGHNLQSKSAMRRPRESVARATVYPIPYRGMHNERIAVKRRSVAEGCQDRGLAERRAASGPGTASEAVERKGSHVKGTTSAHRAEAERGQTTFPRHAVDAARRAPCHPRHCRSSPAIRMV